MNQIDSEAFGILQRMREAAGLPAADPAKFNITTPAAATPAPAAANPASTPDFPRPDGWDAATFEAQTAAFANLPEEFRHGLQSSQAARRGREALEAAAQSLFRDPTMVHHYIKDPARFVSAETGAVDTTTIAAEMVGLAQTQPGLFADNIAAQLLPPDVRAQHPLHAGTAAQTQPGLQPDDLPAHLAATPPPGTPAAAPSGPSVDELTARMQAYARNPNTQP